MEHTKEALEEVEQYVKSYREDLLRMSMDEAANHGTETGKVERYHVQNAYNRLWD